MPLNAPDQPVSRHVSQQRLQARLDTLARFGATAKGGVDRQALSREDALAQAQMVRWGHELGLKASRDPAGNLFLRFEGLDDGLPPVLSGSHLDSQPTGGRFDGVFGVVAALEAVQAMVEAGHRPVRAIEVVAWMNEEGSRFAPGMMGSAAFSGARELDEFLPVRDGAGIRVDEALAATRSGLDELLAPEGLSPVVLRPLGGPVAAYVEAHIEQGPVLERVGLSVGIVSGIQGKHTWRIEVLGEAAHAGTSTRAERKDALMAALAMVQAMAQVFHDEDDVTKFTVGRFEVEPNTPSVVASRAVFSIDLRHPDTDRLNAMSQQVQRLCTEHRGPCEVVVQRLSAADSLSFSAGMRQLAQDCAQAQDIATLELPSAAGHDARYLSPLAPSAMLFVPCHLGITHNEAEYASPHDLWLGTRVLADMLQALTTASSPESVT